MLRPIWVWQLDDEGNPKLDKNGERIPHKKAGERKADKDLSDADRQSQVDQQTMYHGNRRRNAAAVLRPIADAEAVLNETS